MTRQNPQPVSFDGLAPLPPRPVEGHKGTFGTVIVVGGSRTMIGAPALCARAALRGGAGLVKIAALPAVLPHALTIEPAATGVALDFEHDADSAMALLDDADPDGRAVLAVGPGWGQSVEARRLLELLLAGRRTMVLDADGLNLLAALLGKDAQAARPPQRTRGEAPRGPRVLTPHPGEFRRLAQGVGLEGDTGTGCGAEAHRSAAAATLCGRLGVDVLLLKGHRTVVTDGRRAYVNATGNPALATAGSGDVLTGLIAALLAQGMAAFDAAAWAAHLHGRAADNWAGRHGLRGLHAMELADALPDAMRGG